MTEQTCTIIDNTVTSLAARVNTMDLQAMCLRLVGDLRALILVYSVQSSAKPPAQLLPTLTQLKKNVQQEITTLEPEGILKITSIVVKRLIVGFFR